MARPRPSQSAIFACRINRLCAIVKKFQTDILDRCFYYIVGFGGGVCVVAKTLQHQFILDIASYITYTAIDSPIIVLWLSSHQSDQVQPILR